MKKTLSRAKAQERVFRFVRALEGRAETGSEFASHV